MEELDRTIQDGIWIGISDREPDMLYLLSSTDFMCNNDILYDIDNSIEKNISSRISIYYKNIMYNLYKTKN